MTQGETVKRSTMIAMFELGTTLITVGRVIVSVPSHLSLHAVTT